MHGDTVLTGRTRANSSAYTGALFVLVASALLMRAALPAPFIDLFINYTPYEGSIIEKIHPGTHAITGVFVLTALTMRASLDAWSYHAARTLTGFGAAIAILIIYLGTAGRIGAAGYLVDTYIAAILGGLTLLLFPVQFRTRAAHILLAMVIASVALALVEFGTGARIMPYPFSEDQFRPTGLAGHPLALGLITATAILFVSISSWRTSIRMMVIALMFVGVAAAGARIAMLAASIATAFALFTSLSGGGSSTERARIRTLLVVGGAIVLAGALTVLAAGGFIDRFVERGVSDTSAMARVDVYKLFALTSWKDILLGTDVARIAKIAETQLNLAAIESSIVVAVFQFGVFGAILFALALMLTVRRLLVGAPAAAWAATLLFFAVALSNNTLTAKTPVVLILFTLLIGVQAQRMPRSHAYH